MSTENFSVRLIDNLNTRELIEYAGRICWRSEPNGNVDAFINKLIERGHTSVLEHAAVSLVDAPDGKHIYRTDSGGAVANLRALLQMMAYGAGGYTDAVLEEFRIKALDAEMSEHRAVFEIVCDRAVSHELVRHRVMSFTQESQRYVNTVKKDGELPVVESRIAKEKLGWFVRLIYKATSHMCWIAYLIAIKCKVTPQFARMILPNMTKTRVIMSGYMWEWVWFLELRADNAAHPDMRIIAERIKEVLIYEKGLRRWYEVSESNERLKYINAEVVVPA
jgi:thymidylate synthase ThyX